jgi:hypothetical protein
MRILLAALVVMAISACSANHKSIHRVTNLEGTGPVVISVDAKQRAIIANSRPYPGNDDDSNGTYPAHGSTIARTQSVNLLREIMFRTCERYMNGAIDELEMTIQAARDHRLIVSILAIEQLTGAVTPRPVTISASGSGTAGASADAMLVVEDARKGLVRAEDEAKAAKTAFDKVNTPEKICDADPVLDANKAKCDEKRSAMTKANEAHGKAAERFQLLSGLACAGGVSVSTTTEANAPGGTLGVQPTSITDVAAAVENIVLMNTADPSGRILSTCVDYISRGITAGTPGAVAIAQPR